MTPLVGTLASPTLLRSTHVERDRLLKRILDSGIDHVFLADHVSFRVGTGMDGLINAATLAALDPRLRVVVGVYLLALRHPIAVARQLSTFAEAAPGQLVLGVGVGGEDRNEFEMLGVDPRTRGKRTDEALEILRALATGEPVDHAGEFYRFERAWVRPAPQPPIPIVIGGRSSAALRRAARFGDGWLGVWSSPERFAKAIETVAAEARLHARAPTMHGIQLWAGVDRDRATARERLAKEMYAFYRVPFEQFERYSPFGSAADVATFLAPYRDAGCRLFNITLIAESEAASIAAVAEIKDRLKRPNPLTRTT
jgi:alkanesulfonate monooxygenase SsuD/methylene tetrahydromethanopterin reductase-like flavin-dependent oxidoreductase (luciferase family)